jgi:hypothetical protein
VEQKILRSTKNKIGERISTSFKGLLSNNISVLSPTDYTVKMGD